MLRKRKTIILVSLLTVSTSFLWLPAIALGATGQADKFQYYIEALKHGLEALVEYFKFIIELFKTAV